MWIAYAVLLLKGINPIEADLSQMSKGLGLLVSLAAVGVPLGYVMHQVYFGIAWVMNQWRNFDEIKSIIEKKYLKRVDGEKTKMMIIFIVNLSGTWYYSNKIQRLVHT
ncbi:hypothetical protein BAHan_5625 [Bacillus anthracis]|nr:hypothetical protein BACvac02_5485 [Bacillus anthracis]AIM14494.1 hypothetical protein BAHan_5625 [Bacillus anthracis]